ncbi:hypothetical protein Taro_056763 [Colocasia esculenta]|uniref:Uncharacterized protein n=1 Tax=Colocasia esculenta TaxID=4460 RepID=A0A843XWN5_COLES|nr:hypothetical protein [Colocasia esculenta]
MIVQPPMGIHGKASKVVLRVGGPVILTMGTGEMGTREGVTGLGVGLDEEVWKGEGDGGEGEVAARMVCLESIEMMSSGE